MPTTGAGGGGRGEKNVNDVGSTDQMGNVNEREDEVLECVSG